MPMAAKLTVYTCMKSALENCVRWGFLAFTHTHIHIHWFEEYRERHFHMGKCAFFIVEN